MLKGLKIMAKNSEARLRANKKWDDNNREFKNKIIAKSTAKRYINNLCDLSELQELSSLINAVSLEKYGVSCNVQQVVYNLAPPSGHLDGAIALDVERVLNENGLPDLRSKANKLEYCEITGVSYNVCLKHWKIVQKGREITANIKERTRLAKEKAKKGKK